MSRGIYFALSFVLAAGCQEPATAPTGTWTGLAVSPGNEIIAVSYEVVPAGDSLAVTLALPRGELPVQGFRLRGDSLFFAWNPGFLIECRLVRGGNDVFRGGCLDGDDNVGPIAVAPPGVAVVPDDLDLDHAYGVWGRSRVATEQERYRQRRAAHAYLGYVVDAEPQGRFVEVEGARRYVLDRGEGPLTIVLEAGAGDDHLVWRAVQDSLAGLARVVAYDRAGLGRSDAAEAPRLPARLAGELNALLEAIEAPPPYVFVAHADGAFIARAFAAQHPDAVAGLVLLDPSHERLAARWQTLDEDAWRGYLARKRDFYAVLPGAAAAEFAAFSALVGADAFPEGAAMPVVPAVLISGLRPPEGAPTFVETDEGLAAKRDEHAAWAARQPGMTHWVTQEAGGHVHLEQPALVVEAVREVLAAVQSER